MAVANSNRAGLRDMVIFMSGVLGADWGVDAHLDRTEEGIIQTNSIFCYDCQGAGLAPQRDGTQKIGRPLQEQSAR